MDGDTLKRYGFEQVDGHYKLKLDNPALIHVNELTAELDDDGTLHIRPLDIKIRSESRLKRLIFNLTTI